MIDMHECTWAETGLKVELEAVWDSRSCTACGRGQLRRHVAVSPLENTWRDRMIVLDERAYEMSSA